MVLKLGQFLDNDYDHLDKTHQYYKRGDYLAKFYSRHAKVTQLNNQSKKKSEK